MPFIENISVATPSNRVDHSVLPDIAETWLGNNPKLAEKYIRIATNSGVENRNLILPYSQILEMGGLSLRSKIFEELGEPLLRKAVLDTLNSTTLSKTDFSHIIFTSCSVPVIPSIDAKLVLNLGLENTIKRIPIFQHGCVGGVVGLSLGAQLAKLGKGVLVVSLELCSLVFQFRDYAGSQLVGASIFSDGAASVVISPNQGKLNFIDTLSYLILNSEAMMGYDIFDDGFHLRLDRELPSLLLKEVPDAMQDFLAKNGVEFKDVNYFLFHPGGKKILDFFEEKLELKPEQCRWAREVLRDLGNMSSATIHFVLHRFLSEVSLKPGDNVLIMGIGPGLTLEFILLNA